MDPLGTGLAVVGITGAMGFTSIGVAKAIGSGADLIRAGELHELSLKTLLPLVLGSALIIYALVPSVMICLALNGSYSLIQGVVHMGVGLLVGVTSFASGYAIGKVGSAGVAVMAKEELFFVWMVIAMMAEFIAILGFVVAMMFISSV
ncbi:UNVERIFIED_CONTAM: hypothetical protein RMT77_013460 [Armadillidium vulgare]|nr:V-type proton ATPase subunit c [Armadillidium vulgare]